jgi:phenylacetate-CoA ligase
MVSPFFRLRSYAGSLWPPLPEPGLAQVWSAYLTLDRTQWWDPDEIEQHQLCQLRELLRHCARHVPYYAETLASHGIAADSIQSLDDFRRVPLLSRRTWQDRFDDLRARQLPEGTVALDEDSTSGTSGVPVRVLKTNLFYVWWLAFYLRDLEWSGLDPTGAMAAIRPTLKSGAELDRLLRGERMAAWQPVLRPLIEMGPLYGMDIAQDPRRQLEWLGEVNPDYLLSHASNLGLLAGLLLDRPRRFPRLRAVQAISETLTDEDREKIEAAFGAPVKNLYSCAEAGYLASPCPQGHGLHVHAENVLLEVLDDAGRPCAPGEAGRVVLTVLHGFLAPFVRYEIGDLVTPAPGRCPCGRGLPLLTGVLGKRRPLFRLANGAWKHSSGLVHALSAVGGHHQHQAVQKAIDHVVVRVVPNRDWTTGHLHAIRTAVREFLEVPVRVDVEVRERLELPRGGKLQSMVCEVPPGEAV